MNKQNKNAAVIKKDTHNPSNREDLNITDASDPKHQTPSSKQGDMNAHDGLESKHRTPPSAQEGIDEHDAPDPKHQTPSPGKEGTDSHDVPDPNFAEQIINDIHTNTEVPQISPVSTEHIAPLTAEKIDYQEPEIRPLHKQPILEKSTNLHASIPVEKMPITLTFETGRQKITIGELEKIKEGYTFECGNLVDAPVTICANDTPIGTGELLDIDGRIGVRIIEFYHK